MTLYNRLIFADAIRAYAIILVIMLHISGNYVLQFGVIDTTAWWVMNIIDSFSRPAVPLFVMLSGMLLLDSSKKEGIGCFLKGRLARVGIPLVVWSVIYQIWRVIYYGELLGIQQVIVGPIQGPVYPHLWFVYMILGLYLLTPVLRVYVRYSSRNNQLYLLALWLVFTGVLPILDRNSTLQLGIYLSTVQFAGYFLLGHLLRDGRITGRHIGWMLLLALGLVVFTAVGTFVVTVRNDGGFIESLYGNNSPNVVFLSIVVFLILKSFNYKALAERLPVVSKSIAIIAPASFTIYLSHPIFLELFQGGQLGFQLDAMTPNPVLGLSITTIATVVLCLLLASALRPLPLARHITG